MNDGDLIQALRRMAPETGWLHCLGCGYEHGCSLHGCAVIRRAAERLEQLTVLEPTAPLTLEELRAMDGEPVWSNYYQCWGLISVHTSGRWSGVPFFLFTEDGYRHEKNVEQRRLTLYRRKPGR